MYSHTAVIIIILPVLMLELGSWQANGLSCYNEINWVSYGSAVKESRSKHKCYNGGQYCVKVEATSSRVYGVQRRCDRELKDLPGIQYCQAEGCFPETSGYGTVCCCRSDYCNKGNSISYFHYVLIAAIFLIYFCSL